MTFYFYSLFSQLSIDDSPMVRRAAAKALVVKHFKEIVIVEKTQAYFFFTRILLLQLLMKMFLLPSFHYSKS
jgi:hypothetical protein